MDKCALVRGMVCESSGGCIICGLTVWIQVTGEEEIPEGVVAVITPDAPDVLSHVSVRARNMRVLFATCHDEAPLKQLRDAKGERLAAADNVYLVR